MSIIHYAKLHWFRLECDRSECPEGIGGTDVRAIESKAKERGWTFIHCQADGRTYHLCPACAGDGRAG